MLKPDNGVWMMTPYLPWKLGYLALNRQLLLRTKLKNIPSRLPAFMGKLRQSITKDSASWLLPLRLNPWTSWKPQLLLRLQHLVLPLQSGTPTIKVFPMVWDVQFAPKNMGTGGHCYYICTTPNCDFRASKIGPVWSHVTVVHTMKEAVCPEYAVLFLSPYSMREHMFLHFPECKPSTKSSSKWACHIFQTTEFDFNIDLQGPFHCLSDRLVCL